jgi:4-carboxymuconolactone decarboxylase
VLRIQDRAMPSDIDPQSGFRLPLPKREELDEAGRAAYDRAVTPGRTIAGLQGPAGVQLYSPKIAPHVSAINQYLRFEAGYSPRLREIAILTTAREMDSQFEWVAHEPEALKVGVPETVIDAIKYRRDTSGLDAADAMVIELGRALWRDHKVSPDLFARAKTLFGPHTLIDLVLLRGTMQELQPCSPQWTCSSIPGNSHYCQFHRQNSTMSITRAQKLGKNVRIFLTKGSMLP